MSDAFQSDGMGDSDGLPKWACPECGDIFKAITQAELDEKANNHSRDCDGREDPETQQGDAAYTLKTQVYPPRDLDQYLATAHFQHVRKRRRDPDVDSDIISKIVAEGQIKHTHNHDRIIFELWQDGWQWWIVVAVRDEAFLNCDEKHRAVTVYCKNSDQHEAISKYV